MYQKVPVTRTVPIPTPVMKKIPVIRRIPVPVANKSDGSYTHIVQISKPDKMYLPCLDCKSKEDDRSRDSEEYKGQHKLSHSQNWDKKNKDSYK